MTDSNASPVSLKPARTRSELKADVTDRTARAIIEAESKRREAKTERLRQARLESEAPDATAASSTGQPPAAQAASRRKRPAKAKRGQRKEAGR